MGKYAGLKSPYSGKIGNPLKKGNEGKLKAHHEKNLGACGVKSPKSPL